MAEVTQCPQCQRKLNVQEAQLGQTVQCPVCGSYFTAVIAGNQRQPPPPPVREEEPPPRRPPDYDDRGRQPPPRRDYEDDYPDRGRGRPPAYGRDPYRDDYPRNRPHRGGAIIALGIAGLCLSCIPLAGWGMGGAAIGMANSDIAEMNRGAMDPSGRGMTEAGRVCGIIAIVLSTLIFVFACLINLADR